MVQSRDTIRKWVKRHTNKHLCFCGCGEFIEIRAVHKRTGIPKFIKGHNFTGKFNPQSGEEFEFIVKSPSWEILPEEEKKRRISNLKKFGKGKDHPQWSGGRIRNDEGYVSIHCPEHPLNNNGYVFEHRLVMEKYLIENFPDSDFLIEIEGKKVLNPVVVVHHKKHDQKDNNDISNLFPFPNSAAHIFWHHSSLPDDEKIERIKLGLYTSEDKEVNNPKEGDKPDDKKDK